MYSILHSNREALLLLEKLKFVNFIWKVPVSCMRFTFQLDFLDTFSYVPSWESTAIF